MKLYRYRPLNEFLFKELLYQELYFASYLELNDPLDLSAKIDFSPRKVDDIEKLITYFLFGLYTTKNEENLNEILVQFNSNEESRKAFCSRLFDALKKINSLKKFVSFEDVEKEFNLISKEFYIDVSLKKIKDKLIRQTEKFLQNSSAICFSETNNNFLMWSHYATKHSGICLEFTLENPKLPYKYDAKSEISEKFQQDFAVWKNRGIILTEHINKVTYQSKQPYINFFQFAFIFIKENDFSEDDVNYEFSEMFSLKTTPWKYEKEWRSVQINFNNNEQPEDRIRHYPIDCLTAIYFGIRTPEATKYRIYNIFKLLDKQLNYFECVQTDSRKLKFKKWEYFEE